ncbi:MAG: cyclic nucleotide-binding domain-containing protein [Bdellovibrionia bacterium]
MNHELLKSIYLFREMSADELRKIAELASLDTYQRGDEVFTQGDSAKALYVIKFGSIRIYQKGSAGDKIEVAILGTGSHFGEMAFIDNEKRSATAEIMEKSEIFRLDYDKLSAFLKSSPGTAVTFYKALTHFLCGRLRVTTTDLSFSREMNLRHF